MTSAPFRAQPPYTSHAYRAEALRVIAGACLGENLAGDTAVPGDVYRLDGAAELLPLPLTRPCIGGENGAGQQDGGGLRPLRLLTLLSGYGERGDVLLVEGAGIGRMAVPLSPLCPRADYTLIDVGPVPAGLRVADIVCAAFAPGTRIARPDGSLCPIGSLSPGDLVLTRDNGPQPIRWIGRVTLSARGHLAPVVISAGALGNIGDLAVSPGHRIFVYQRGTGRIGASAALLVQARHLVDGERIYRREGAYADYISLVFDRHEILFAEGVPVESQMIGPAILPVLPDPLPAQIHARLPGLAQTGHAAPEPPAASLVELRNRVLHGAGHA